MQEGHVHAAGRRLFGFLGHVAAIVVGGAFMLGAITMGVTVVMLPLAIPLGFLGLGIFLWGLLEYADNKRKRTEGG